MVTEKLYYQDRYMRSFTARLQKSDRDEKGHFYVILNQTAFYPTGGGQPHDTGTLNGVNVYDVVEIDGEVRHYIEEPAEIHEAYIGEIDWNRRFDHMQQHTGQHILSAAFEEEFNYKTVSFHLGAEICSIDLEVESLPDEETAHVEKTVNNIIMENRPVETRWVSKEELSNFSLRKEVSVVDNIRLVIIPNFDYNGCGGTHPDSTGQVSSIKILHWEKQKKKKIRVYFVSGMRVLKQLDEKHKVIQELTNTLNSPQQDLNETAIRNLRLNQGLEKKVNELNMEMIEYEAESYIEQAESQINWKIAKAIFYDRPMPELQQLAKRITAKSDGILVLLINEKGDKLQLVCSRSNDVVINMNDLVKNTLPVIDGKGGGSDSIAQGGGDRLISAEELMMELMNQAAGFKNE
ncbi:alanyl-tRNA synthetase [Virgibacillus subterraneus]|uniref:Alanyl-tRNA synthetase n=1 Tax=Virgibacillus subterraneus TaxID=621109 RepID=A0A1H9GGG8_9BACI|nr:DHHA1 domain-containing protein [Virgibacillus subterraneus]SEQ48948.1 alanyl-tRNA synthetase [Virgibacillus subterraneus]